MTRCYKVFSSKTVWIWLAMVLQLIFAKKILDKNCDNEGFKKIELVKISLRALIINMLYIKVWSRRLIFSVSISISIMFFCLVKAYFSIFFHKSIIFKVKSDITLWYIVAYAKIQERLISDKKKLSKSLLSSTLCKYYWVCARLVYFRHSVISGNF